MTQECERQEAQPRYAIVNEAGIKTVAGVIPISQSLLDESRPSFFDSFSTEYTVTLT